MTQSQEELITAMVIEEIKNLAFRKVGPDDSLIKSKLLDSITIVDLAVALEERAGVKIPFTEITEEWFESPRQIARYLMSKTLV
jgi:D-alanine--poly(phosphoribitol) ligase subunit 2